MVPIFGKTQFDRPLNLDCSAHESWNSLSSLAELIVPKARTRAEFLEELKSGELDAVFVAYRTFNSVDITGRFDAELVKLLPASLKFICHNGMSEAILFFPVFADSVSVLQCISRVTMPAAARFWSGDPGMALSVCLFWFNALSKAGIGITARS